jgi:FdhD protein
VGRVTSRRRVLRIEGGQRVAREDLLAVEEPLEVRVGGQPYWVTMRTPGDDVDLVHGLLLAEGVAVKKDDVLAARYCAGVDAEGRATYNVLDVTLAPGVAPPPASLARSGYTSSACGVCGAQTIDAVLGRRAWEHQPPSAGSVTVAVDVLAALPDALRLRQQVFARTGGLHAAGLFTLDGETLCVREDVGRHNALDKVLGWALREGRLPLAEAVVQVSGRASFELVQKALMGGVPVLAAVSAPSSLAVDLAQQGGLVLVGFSRGGRMNVYAGAERIG